MGDVLELSGSDLENGIAADEVVEGRILRGHAFGQPVLLVREDGEVHAIGAACTHYGAPLDEGLLVGDTVRCPWHHACFALKTGEAVRAPALDPLPRYAVEESGGRVRVTGPAPEAGRRTHERGGPSAVVIVGAGAAGSAAAVALRQEGYEGPITVLDGEPDEPVDRPNLSKDYLAGTAPEEWVPLRDEAWFADKGIDLRRGVAVVSVEPGPERVVLEDGQALSYGALLLAPGAGPIRLRMPGVDQSHVHVLRTWGDARGILAGVVGAQRAVLIGAGFIGLEAAASLRAQGLEVTVVAPEEVPLERILGRAVGEVVRKAHEDAGVVFRLGRTAEAIEADSVRLSDGTSLPADLVVMGVGVRPRTGLAQAAGLEVDNGIVVDTHLGTSAEGIWAAGDAARWLDPRSGDQVRVEHWALAQRMGQAAARNILGHAEPFGPVPFFWSAHPGDLVIQVVGIAHGWSRIDVDGDIAAHDAALAYRDGERTLAVATLGRDATSLRAEALLEVGDHEALIELIPRGDA